MTRYGLSLLLCVVVLGCSSGGETPEVNKDAPDIQLNEAIAGGDTDTVAAILDANPQLVNQPNAIGDTPLHTAARTNNEDMIKLLLERGAYIDVRNDSEELPAEVAAASGASPELIELLRGGA